MTLPVLCGARVVLFLALGEDKAEAVAKAFAGPPDPQMPASLVRSTDGETLCSWTAPLLPTLTTER